VDDHAIRARAGEQRCNRLVGQRGQRAPLPAERRPLQQGQQRRVLRRAAQGVPGNERLAVNRLSVQGELGDERVVHRHVEHGAHVRRVRQCLVVRGLAHVVGGERGEDLVLDQHSSA